MQFEGSMTQQQDKHFFQKLKDLIGLKNECDFNSPEPYCPHKFESDDPNFLDYFNLHGYVVIKNVATPEEVKTAISLFWDLVEQQQPKIKRTDPATWVQDWVADGSVGIMAGYGIGQSEFLWFVRKLPKVKEIFAKIWGTDDLLVSFDGCGVLRPLEYDPKWGGEYGTPGWYHIDQNCYNKKGRNAVQGLLNMFPSGSYDGGFVVVPKSTQVIAAAFEKYTDICSKKTRDFVRVFPDQPFWVEAINNIKRNSDTKYDMLPVKINLEPGEFVMWDSRTIHCNHPATKPSKDPLAKTQLKRLVAYVCMTPASFAKDIEKLAKFRVFAFQRGITTTHWPHEFQPSWSTNNKLPGVGASVVKLTPEQAKLITGNSLNVDVYDESFVEGVDLNDL